MHALFWTHIFSKIFTRFSDFCFLEQHKMPNVFFSNIFSTTELLSEMRLGLYYLSNYSYNEIVNFGSK